MLQVFVLLSLLTLFSCNPAGQTQIAESFMPGVNSSRIISISSGDHQTALHSQLLPQPLVVMVKDDQNKPVENVKILWSTSAGTLAQAFSYTNESGQASNTLTLAGPGIHTLTARVEESISGVTFTVTATTNSFTSSWPFTSSTDYLFNSSVIEFDNGIVKLSAADQTDDDFTDSGFRGGSLIGVEYDEDGQQLLILDNGGCDVDRINCLTLSHLDSSWTPHWTSLKGYWKLNETSGNSVIDSSTNSNTGTAGLGVTLGSTGKVSHSANFSGTNSYIDIPDSSSLNITGNVTASAWIYPTVAASGYVFSLGSDSVGGGWGLLLNCGSGTCNASVVINNAAYSVPMSAVSMNQWTHLAAVRNGTTLHFYVNGIRISSVSVPSGSLRHANSSQIGTIRSGASYLSQFKGKIDEVAVWNVALSDAEIGKIHSRQAVKTGIFESRIMDAFSNDQSWSSLSWFTALPFLKELPGSVLQNETADSYPELVGSSGNPGDNDLMTGLTALWHLNEVSPTETFGGVTLESAGRFKNAIKFDGSSGYVNTGRDISWSKTDNMTISFWMKADRLSGNQGIIGRGAAGGYGVGNWEWSFRLTGNSLSYIQWDTSGGAQVIVSANATAGAWEHFVMVYTGSVPKAELYKNGALISTDSTISGTLQNRSTPILLGHAYFNGGTNYYYAGSLDEIAMWNRALHPNEIKQLYRRGANRISYQVRTCSSFDCSDDAAGNNWKGSDGTKDTYYSELNSASINSPAVTLSGMSGQYFQYRAVMESDEVASSPALKRVSVGPDHYDKSSPTVVSKNALSFYALSSLAETLGGGCSEGVAYNVSLDKTVWHWWNGTNWTVADGSTAQANSIGQITAAAESFGSQVGRGSLYIKAFLKSDGSSKCELDNLEVRGEI